MAGALTAVRAKNTESAGDGIIETYGVYSSENYCSQVWSEQLR